MKNIDKNSLNSVINTSKKLLKLLYILLIVVGAYLILRILKELHVFDIVISILKILSPLFIGIVIAWLLNPFVKFLTKKKVRRGLACVLSYVILIGCIILLIQAIIPLLYRQTIDLVSNFPNIFSSLKNWASGIFSNFDTSAINIELIKQNLFSKLDEFSTNLSKELPTTIISGATSLVSSIGVFVMGLVIGFYLLLSCNNLGNNLLDLLPKKIRKTTSELCTKINQSLRSYVNGAIFDSFIVFVASSIAFAIIGLKAPLLFGLFCGLTNVIPYAGPYIGGIPAVIVGLSESPGIGIAVLIAIVIIQVIEGNILHTIIISKTTKLNPVIIIIGLLIFGHFFGMIGMLLSTPIIGVLKVIINYFNDKYDFLNFN